MNAIEFINNVISPALFVGVVIAAVLIYQTVNLVRDLRRTNALVEQDNHRVPITTTQKEE